MIKRLIVIFLCCILLCGCSSKTGCEEINFSSWGSVSEVKIIKTLISEFEKENPDIKINFMHIPQNYFQKIHLLFASNTEPDVIFINNLSLPVYASKLEDLSAYTDKSDYYPATIEGLSYQGQLLAIPRDVSNLLFYVNTDIVPLPKSSWSMDDFLNTVMKFNNQNIFGVSYEEKVFYALPYLKYFGGGILDNEHNLIINSEKSQKGLDFYKDLKNKYRVAPTKSQVGSSTQAQMFIDGKIVLYLSGRWMYPIISQKAKFNWAVINFPYGELPAPCDVSGWALAKNSRHKDAAIKFITFLSNEESSKYFAETGLIVPARIEASKLLDNDTHNEKAFLDVIKYSKSTEVSKDYSKLTDKLNSELNF